MPGRSKPGGKSSHALRPGRGPTLAACLAGLALVAGAAPAPAMVHPEFGYRLEVPRGWRHKLVASGDSLLLAGPGGLRVRVDAELSLLPLDLEAVQASYLSDGRALKDRPGGPRAMQRPQRDGKLDGHPAFAYGIAYKEADGTVRQVVARLAGGPSKEAISSMRVVIRIYGPRASFPVQAEAIDGVLRSFRFPEAPALDEDLDEPQVAARVVDPRASEPVDLVALTASTGSRARAKAAAGDAEAPRPTFDPGARAYDRGSLSGGVGFMKEARVIQDPRRVAAMRTAFGVSRAERSEEEKKRAAARLGFQLE